jgi:hypothetical protein
MNGVPGADFVAVVRLTNKAGAVLAAPGDTCERVPAASLEWLERDGLIKRAERPRRKPAAKSADEGGE